MKLPNGFGSVYKLKDKPRRKPWMAIRTMRWDIDEEKRTSRQVRKVIGYYATKQEAITALTHYNENPYDLDSRTLTFSDVYENGPLLTFLQSEHPVPERSLLPTGTVNRFMAYV